MVRTFCVFVFSIYSLIGFAEVVPDNSQMVSTIDLRSFSSDFDYNANTVHLRWETVSETNSYMFVLQRSEDMELFEDVCIVKAAGNSASVSSYNCSDVKPFRGMSFYRLKQISRDKSEIYSDEMSVNAVFPDNQEAAYIIPNPNDGEFRLLIPSSKNNVEVQILDEMGQLIKMLSITNDQPNFYISLNLKNTLAKGRYYVTIDAEDMQHVKMMRVVNSW